MITTNRIRGDLGEKKAVEFLKSRGFRIIERNYQNKYGEIDIICQRNNNIHFIEVKTSYTDFRPEENMTINKLNKILKTANVYLFEKNKEDISVFFDLVSVNFKRKMIRLYPNINSDLLD